MFELRNKRITVAGLGRFGGGIEVARWLVGQGAQVLVTDKEPAEKLAESVAKLDGLPIEFRLGEHREEDFTSADLVVTSPAIPPTNPYLIAAKDAKVPISTEIRLFIERCPATIVGVTGTKGKSTTSTLLGLMLKTRFNTFVGGNIGGSLLEKLPAMKKSDVVVLELSSYMLEHLRSLEWSPHVALVTMITNDHLEWHGSVDAYIDAKKNLVRFQKSADFAVLGEDDPISKSFADASDAKIVWYGVKDRKPFSLKLPGTHNQLNAQAAFAAAAVLGVAWEQAQDAIAYFAGLTHRLQLVHEANGIRYFNDSIATIPQAAVAALESFPAKRVIQIVGGYDKKLDLSGMCDALARRAKAALCIGKTGPKISEMIQTIAVPDRAQVYDCIELAEAMKIAKQIAQPGDVVLLSTGCASYDQFTNFESRGDAFAKLAKETIPG